MFVAPIAMCIWGCIDVASVCDGQINCADASDEICVTELMASKDYDNVIKITIDNRNFCLGFVCQSGQCLNMKYVDDLLPDCPGGQGEDEAKILQLRFEGRSFACENPAYFPCVSGLFVCFPLHAFCLYDPDEDRHPKWCKDGVHVGDCSGINCTNSFKCLTRVYKSYKSLTAYYIIEFAMDKEIASTERTKNTATNIYVKDYSVA